MRATIKLSAPNLLIKTNDINIAIASLLRYKEAQEQCNSGQATWYADKRAVDYKVDDESKITLKEQPTKPKKSNYIPKKERVGYKYEATQAPKSNNKSVSHSPWTDEENQLLLDNVNEKPKVLLKLFANSNHSENAIRTRLQAFKSMDKSRISTNIYNRLKEKYNS